MMKLITDSNLELIIQRFYERLLEEFPSLTVENANKLTQGRTLTIGETGKVFDGSQDVFWSLNEIGAVSKGTISDLNTSNKTVVGAINELQNNKASVSYVNNAIENVTIDDAVTAVELIGNVEDVEFDFVTQEELEDALANLDDIDIEGMVTAVDVGNVDIEQGGGGTVSAGVAVNSTYVSDANNTNDIIGYYPTHDGTLNLPPNCYNIAGDNNYSLWGILFTQIEPKHNTIVQQYIPTWGAWANVTFTRTYNKDDGFTSWVYHLDSSEWDVELQTNNKSIIGAINELFQNANNGKELIASAIGEPLSSEDTFSAMSNDINSLLSTFKTNMMNNGVTVESSDRFKQLIDKLADTTVEVTLDIMVRSLNNQIYITYPENLDFGCVPEEVTIMFENQLTIEYPNVDKTKTTYISGVSRYGINFAHNGMVPGDYNARLIIKGRKDVGKGIQFTEGSFNLPSQSSLPTDTIIEHSMGFIPTFIIVIINHIKYDSCNIYKLPITNVESTKIPTNNDSNSMNFQITNITDTSFTINNTGRSAYIYTDTLATYYAIGVGEEDTTLRDSLADILKAEGVSVSSSDTMASLITKVDNELDRQVVPQGTATASDVASGKTFINSTGQLLTGTASASENGLVLKTGTVTTGSNGVFEISNLDIEPLIFWATTDCTYGIEEISYNRYKSTDSFETSLYVGEEGTNVFEKLYFSNFGANYNLGVTNNRIRLLSTYGTTIYYNILGIGEGGNVSGGGSSSGNYHTIMENNVLANNYQFFNSASSYGNNFQHSNNTGLYSSSLDSGYVSYITLTSTIDFNYYSAIEIDAFNYHSGSSTEFCVFAGTKALNQISKTSINTIVSITDEKTVSSTNTSTFIFDLSDFSGTYYLGIARVANSTSLHIKGIRLIKWDSSGSGSQVQPRV